jgi:large subunit ribosomal protein L23
MNDKILYGILGRPVVTEKTTVQKDRENKVVFRVSDSANKIQIRDAIERLFFAGWDKAEKGAPVLSVNTLRMPKKPKRVGRVAGHRAGFKKAVVSLAPGASVEFYEASAEVSAPVVDED